MTSPPPKLERICVFCGSSSGVRHAYVAAARALGEALARRGLGLVYGGAAVGLMGALADAATDAGVHVVGVIPEALELREIAHRGIAELVVVDSMHARKATMASRADAFVALPGGIGTFEEFFEILTWRVLGLHRKPIGLLDVEGYFGPLRAMLDHARSEGFVNDADLAIEVAEDPEDLLDRLARSSPQANVRWLRSTDET
jgi:uncharacterized protein (TIGR00730 family)